MKKLLFTCLCFICAMGMAQEHGLPDNDPFSANFITMGKGFSSIQEGNQITLDIFSTGNELIINVLNGNMHGGQYSQPLLAENEDILPSPDPSTWISGVSGATGDVQIDASGQFPAEQNQMLYQLFSKDGNLIAQETGDNLGELADGFVNLFTVSNAQNKSYALVLTIIERNAEITDMYHIFKIASSGSIKTNDQIGFVTKDYSRPIFIGVPSNMMPKTLAFDFVPQKDQQDNVCEIQLYDGDYDISTDTAKEFQPETLPFPVNEETLPEGENPGNPPDQMVSFTVTDPSGHVVHFESNPSGDREWEETRIVSAHPSCVVDTQNAHSVLDHLEDGIYTVTVNNLQQDNVIFNVLPKGGIVTTPECFDCTGVKNVRLYLSNWSESRDQSETVRVRVGNLRGTLEPDDFASPILWEGQIKNATSIILDIPEEYKNGYITITVEGDFHPVEFGKAAFYLSCDLQINDRDGNSYVTFTVKEITQTEGPVDCPIETTGCNSEFWFETHEQWESYSPYESFRTVFGTGTTSTLKYNVSPYEDGHMSRNFRRQSVASLLNSATILDYFMNQNEVIEHVKNTYKKAFHASSEMEKKLIFENGSAIFLENNDRQCLEEK